MTFNSPIPHGRALYLEMEWLHQVIHIRLEQWRNAPKAGDRFPEAPDLPEGTALQELHQQYGFGLDERLLLAVALAPHLRPEYLEHLLIKDERTDFAPVIFGGVRRADRHSFYPTIETYLFLRAGDDLEARIPLYRLFQHEHDIMRHRLIELDEPTAGQPIWGVPLNIARETMDQCLFGYSSVPRYSDSFPAQVITTKHAWENLVVGDKTLQQLKEIEIWVRQHEKLQEDENLRRLLQPGFRALFYGPPGTGKSLTGSLIGKSTGKMVFRVDLSQLVSKYIGETEKNLGRIFDRAENKNWILFFDEADSLFGKRTAVKDSHDRFANQGVSYLLQRIEHFNGLTILATNLKSNIDSAFMRRMQAVVHFPMPAAAERKRLWESSFPTNMKRAENLSLDRLSENYEISGGSITNVVQYSTLMALERGDGQIIPEDVLEGLKREYQKLGRVVN